MELTGLKTKLFKTGDKLEDFLVREIRTLKNGDVIAITSKIVALAQGRVGKLEDKKKIIAREAKKVIHTPWAELTLTKDGWCLNAGIDESNADNQLILLPTKSFETAEKLRRFLLKKFSLKHLGVIITDTKSLPLRVGTVCRALSYAGFEPIKSYVGLSDLFGRKSRLTESNVADALATSAGLLMGEGNEQTPLVIIKKAPVKFSNKIFSKSKNKSLSLPPEKDIFAKVFTHQNFSTKNLGGQVQKKNQKINLSQIFAVAKICDTGTTLKRQRKMPRRV